MGMRLSYLLVLWASPLLHEREGSTCGNRTNMHSGYVHMLHIMHNYAYYSTDLSATAC